MAKLKLKWNNRKNLCFFFVTLLFSSLHSWYSTNNFMNVVFFFNSKLAFPIASRKKAYSYMVVSIGYFVFFVCVIFVLSSNMSNRKLPKKRSIKGMNFVRKEEKNVFNIFWDARHANLLKSLFNNSNNKNQQKKKLCYFTNSMTNWSRLCFFFRDAQDSIQKWLWRCMYVYAWHENAEHKI